MDKNQEMWPFGPAPRRECPKADAHEWRIIDLAMMAEPPAPSFECKHCGYRWSRKWTKPEFQAWLDRTNQNDGYYAISLAGMPDEPEYAEP